MEIDVYDKKFVIKSYDDELTLTIDILRNLLTAFNVEIEEVEDDYYSKSKNEEIPVSEMSDLYVRRAFKKMILKEKKRFDEKEKIKVFVRNAINNLERALEEK